VQVLLACISSSVLTFFKRFVCLGFYYFLGFFKVLYILRFLFITEWQHCTTINMAEWEVTRAGVTNLSETASYFLCTD